MIPTAAALTAPMCRVPNCSAQRATGTVFIAPCVSAISITAGTAAASVGAQASTRNPAAIGSSAGASSREAPCRSIRAPAAKVVTTEAPMNTGNRATNPTCDQPFTSGRCTWKKRNAVPKAGEPSSAGTSPQKSAVRRTSGRVQWRPPRPALSSLPSAVPSGTRGRERRRRMGQIAARQRPALPSQSAGAGTRVRAAV